MRETIEPLSVNDLLARAVQTLDELLPDGWGTSISPATQDPYADRRFTPDALLEVLAPDGSTVAFAVTAKLTLAGRDATAMLRRLRLWGEQHGTASLVTARYLSSTVRDLLAEAGASFVDATGNVNIGCSSPAIAISRSGLSRDPWRRSRSRDALRGEPASLVARALCDFAAPMQIAHLVELSGASVAATYRVLDLLFDEGLAIKGERGWIETADWPRLLRRWSADWSAAERRFTLGFALPDGVDAALTHLAGRPRGSYLVGGRHAAGRLVAGEPRRLTVHCEQPEDLAKRLRAEPTGRHDDGELIVHARGLGAAAARSLRAGKLAIAAPSQAYADLVLAGDIDAAARLLKAMRAEPDAWRTTA